MAKTNSKEKVVSKVKADQSKSKVKKLSLKDLKNIKGGLAAAEGCGRITGMLEAK